MSIAGGLGDFARRRVRRARRRILELLRPDWVRVMGVHLRIPDWAEQMVRRVAYSGFHERSERILLQGSLKPQDRVLELGTGLGFITTLCCRTCGSDAVMTVEADARLLPYIEETFRRNGVAPRLRNGLVGRDDSIREFHAFDELLSSSVEGGEFAGEPVSMRQIPLESLIDEHRPTYLVMDIEGAECDLAGMPLAACVHSMLVELHPSLTGEGRAEATREWLVSEGFSLVRRIKSVSLYARNPELA